MGISPTDDDFTFEQFGHILDKHGKKAVKYVLLRHENIAGIGNGYLQDILFKAKVHPKRKVGELNEEERRELYTAIVGTLNEAVRFGDEILNTTSTVTLVAIKQFSTNV